MLMKDRQAFPLSLIHFTYEFGTFSIDALYWGKIKLSTQLNSLGKP